MYEADVSEEIVVGLVRAALNHAGFSLNGVWVKPWRVEVFELAKDCTVVYVNENAVTEEMDMKLWIDRK